MQATAEDVIEGAIVLLHQHGWMKNNNGPNEAAVAGPRCLLGAVQASLNAHDANFQLTDLVSETIEQGIPVLWEERFLTTVSVASTMQVSTVTFNDKFAREFEDVIDVLEDALDFLRDEQN
jgi:hypothetical protein